MKGFLSTDAIMTSLDGAYRDTLSIAVLDRKLWTASTKDEYAQEILAQATGAEQKALAVRKYLFEGTTRHQALLAASSEVYAAHKALTKPLGAIGWRVLPNGAIADYFSALDPLIQAHDRARMAFEANYDQDKMTGLKALGALGPSASSLYPPVESIAERFKVKYDIVPLPSGTDYGAGIDAATLTRLRLNLEESMRARVEIVFQESINDFKKSLDALIDRLNRRVLAADRRGSEQPAKKVMLTQSVLTTPVVIARTLRRFAAGDWAERMAKLEEGLSRMLEDPRLPKNAEAQRLVLTSLTNLRKSL